MAANGRVSLPAFFIRRAFRIAPVYFFLLIIFGAQSYFIGNAYWATFKDALPYYVSFMNELRFGNWGPTWTLGIEWKFYLVWPVLAFALPMRATTRIVIAFACIGIMILYWYTIWLSPYYYTVLLFGALLAMALNTRAGFALFQPFTTPAGALVATALLVCTQAVSSHLNARLGDANMVIVYGLIVVPFLVAALAPTPLRAVLSHRALSFIGRRSYSIYLVQVMAFQAVSGVFLGAKTSSYALFLTAAMAIIFADRLYQWVEKPMINVGRRLAERFRTDGERAAARLARPIVAADATTKG